MLETIFVIFAIISAILFGLFSIISVVLFVDHNEKEARGAAQFAISFLFWPIVLVVYLVWILFIHKIEE